MNQKLSIWQERYDRAKNEFEEVRVQMEKNQKQYEGTLQPERGKETVTIYNFTKELIESAIDPAIPYPKVEPQIKTEENIQLARKIEAAYEKLAEDYAEKFPNASRFGLAHNLGFRMDESEIVSLLIRAVKTGTVEEIRLSSYQDMFELTEV